MAPLNAALRGVLEKAVVAARDAAERAATAAIATLAVGREEAFATHTPEQRALRVALRARARQLGGGSLRDGLPLLGEEIGYEQWHRMLFARFLIENDLLMDAAGLSLSMEDCEYQAEQEGFANLWQYAAHLAARMLPGIFRADDPSVQVPLAIEGRTALEAILAGLPLAVFTADDGLGWIYQYWQARERDLVNASGRKIAGADLAPATQHFTEDYMVRFLLENSLGAWWAARHPESPLVATFAYLRLLDDGTPSAGTFPGWPGRVAKITVIDPSCGSGHFLVAAFEMLRRMRMEEEGLGEAEAADAVLRDNLFGLELDARCVQIATFALALAAWKAGGYRQVPVPNLACSGIPVDGQLDEWTRLAGDDVNLKNSLQRLYQLFRNAPDLGSLIDPDNVPLQDRMFAPDFSRVGPLLERAISKESATSDPVSAVFGATAKGVVQAVSLLNRTYCLVATNVPYLTKGKQGEVLRSFLSLTHPHADTDLATAFANRCHRFAQSGGTCALVTPQNWLFLGSYELMRRDWLHRYCVNMLARVGSGGTATASWEVSKCLGISTRLSPTSSHRIVEIDASVPSSHSERSKLLIEGDLLFGLQIDQLSNPDARISVGLVSHSLLLQRYASSYQGIKTGDDGRYRRLFWEIAAIGTLWRTYQSTVGETTVYGGLDSIVDWRQEGRDLARLQGQSGWGRSGVAVTQSRSLPVSLYLGGAFDSNMAAIVPTDPALLPAIWAFCSSSEFNAAVRKIDTTLKVTNSTLVKVPFDLERWRRVADESDPLPEPYSNDPTQWLFNGDPADSTDPLQVAVARLLGYRWPQQGADHLSRFADDDGIVPLVPVAGEEPAVERLRSLLTAAYGHAWSVGQLDRLLQAAGHGGKGLDVWLRDGFFEQHVKLFQQRPFIWHVWDGRRGDGFSALVNYHKLDEARLDRLIHTYLGGWIRTQRDAVEAGVPGADDRLVKAEDLRRKLESIRTGEPPYDIFVRWKPLHGQPIGWNPDLNDGVRLNIRPFVTAGVLRSKVNVKWDKDRGKNPDGSERLNDLHYSITEKQAARAGAGR